jgi:hypothetical protein
MEPLAQFQAELLILFHTCLNLTVSSGAGES